MSFVPSILTPAKITRSHTSARVSFTSMQGGMGFFVYKGRDPKLQNDTIIEATAWPQSHVAVVGIDIERVGRAKQSVDLSRDAFETIGRALGYDMTRKG